MEYRKLGSSGIVASNLALGTMYFGSETSEEDAFAVMDAYVEAGGNLIDTANVYVGGKSEEIVGRWFASRPVEVTERIILATKGRNSNHKDVNAPGNSRRSLSRELDESLKRLGRDVIDLYQLHAWDPLTPVEETFSFLDYALRSGKVLYIGLSNFLGWQVQLMATTARDMGVPLPVTLQQQYSLLSRESEWEVFPAAEFNGMGLLPWSPLAGGFLAGKYQRSTKPASDTRAGSEKALYQWTSAEYAESNQNWDTIESVVKIAEEIGVSPAQVALSWLADRPSVIAPIFGARNVAHLRDNLGAADLHLPAEATAELEKVSAPRSGGYPYGAFGTAQRSRSMDGSAPLMQVVGKGSSNPLG